MIMAVSEMREGQGLPCRFALLPNKEQPTYEMILTVLRNKVAPVDTKPTTIVTDFERSVINAIGLVFPETAHTVVNFTFVQQYGIRSKTRVFKVSFVIMPSSRRFCTKCMHYHMFLLNK